MSDPRPAAGPSAARVVLHSAGFLVTSFLMSGNGTVLPQLFYQRYHAGQKELLLAGCLLLATCGAIGGVLATRRAGLTRLSAVMTLGVTLGAEGLLFLVRGAVVYLLLNALAQFGANYLTNQIDHAATARAGERRRLYDGASNLARLLGMLAGPAFFSAYYDHRQLVLAALALAAGLALLSVLSLLPAGARRVGSAAAAPPVNALAAPGLAVADRLILGYASCIYVAFYLLAANTIYLLRDVLKLPDAERRGGTAIVVVCFGALLANGVGAALRGRSGAPGPRLLLLAAPVGLLALAAAVVARGRVLPLAAILGGCVAIGGGYGVFLVEVRDYCSRGARIEGKTALLTLFNNLGNLSGLIAFGVMVTLALSLRGAATGTYPYLLGVVGLLPVAGLPLLFIAATRRRSGAAAA